MQRREIKFRAWDEQTNQMIFDFKNTDRKCYLDEHGVLIRSCWHTLMQFTGLRDKKGVEIYEGDIFQVAANKKYIVKYMECGKYDYEFVGATFVLWFNDELFFPFDEYAMNTGEVIGHIYSTKTA